MQSLRTELTLNQDFFQKQENLTLVQKFKTEHSTYYNGMRKLNGISVRAVKDSSDTYLEAKLSPRTKVWNKLMTLSQSEWEQIQEHANACEEPEKEGRAIASSEKSKSEEKALPSKDFSPFHSSEEQLKKIMAYIRTHYNNPYQMNLRREFLRKCTSLNHAMCTPFPHQQIIIASPPQPSDKKETCTPETLLTNNNYSFKIIVEKPQYYLVINAPSLEKAILKIKISRTDLIEIWRNIHASLLVESKEKLINMWKESYDTTQPTTEVAPINQTSAPLTTTILCMTEFNPEQLEEACLYIKKLCGEKPKNSFLSTLRALQESREMLRNKLNGEDSISLPLRIFNNRDYLFSISKQSNKYILHLTSVSRHMSVTVEISSSEIEAILAHKKLHAHSEEKAKENVIAKKAKQEKTNLRHSNAHPAPLDNNFRKRENSLPSSFRTHRLPSFMSVSPYFTIVEGILAKKIRESYPMDYKEEYIHWRMNPSSTKNAEPEPTISAEIKSECVSPEPMPPVKHRANSIDIDLSSDDENTSSTIVVEDEEENTSDQTPSTSELDKSPSTECESEGVSPEPMPLVKHRTNSMDIDLSSDDENTPSTIVDEDEDEDENTSDQAHSSSIESEIESRSCSMEISSQPLSTSELNDLPSRNRAKAMEFNPSELNLDSTSPEKVVVNFITRARAEAITESITTLFGPTRKRRCSVTASDIEQPEHKAKKILLNKKT